MDRKMSAIKTLKSKLSLLAKNPYINALRGVPLPTHRREDAQLLIAQWLASDEACLIARVGETEGRVIRWFYENRFSTYQKYSYPNELRDALSFNAGFFHTTDSEIDEFARRYISAIARIDVYVSWNPNDKKLNVWNRPNVTLWDLDPFFTRNRWTLALEGKSISIVSPFVSTIARQIPNLEQIHREPLFKGTRFHLIRAPMTNAGASTEGQDWFRNLNTVFESCIKTEAEVFVIGAGAYGLPLAYRLVQSGRKAVVLGGSTQLLFGIRGKRWENDRRYRSLMNESWTRPSIDERPEKYANLEIKGGAYW
jgi:hypothetical protein